MADAHITGMTAAGALAGTEPVEVSQLSATVTKTAATISALASDNSYNDSGSGFVTAGFAVDDRVWVSGFTGNVANNIFAATVTALTAGKMTIGGADGNVIVDDAAGETVTITKWVTRRTTAQAIANLAPAVVTSWKQTVRAATAVAGTLASSFENGDTVDGVVLATGDRILIKNQAAPADNGIYTVNASGTPTRATDADAGSELVGAAIAVAEGTANADTVWICTTNAPITIGATSLAFSQLTGSASTLDGLSDVVITGAAQGDVIYFNGTNFVNLGPGTSGHFLKTQGAGANPVWAAASGSGAAWFLQWSPLLGEAPASNYATLDSRNGHPCLDFDTTTGETAYFHGALPADYSGTGLTVSLWCAATSATTGTIGWLVAIERIDVSSLDIDADSFASDQTVTATTVPGTSGQVLKMSVNISSGANMDSLAAGELFRLRVTRDVANDTAAGDAELLRVTMVQQ